MENLSYSISDKYENSSYNEFDEENNTEKRPYKRNYGYFENNDENLDEFDFANRKSQNNTKKVKNPKRSLNQEDSAIQQKQIPKKRSIKRKNSIQPPKNDLFNEDNNIPNLNIQRKRRKRSVSKKNENQIEIDEIGNKTPLPGMKAVKHTKRNSEKTTRSTKTITRNKDNKQEKNQNFLTNPDYFQKENSFIDEEESYQYKSEISKDNQFEIEISFNKKDKENQVSENLNDSFQSPQSVARGIKSIRSLNCQNSELLNNQKKSFQPKIDEFFYDSYIKPPELRIDTTLVAQSNNHASLKMSEPYQVSTFSKILESESSTNNQNNEYVLRDLIIASESESNTSSKELSYNNKAAKIDHSNNRYSQNSNSDYSEVIIKPKDTLQSRYSNISAINNDNQRKNTNKTNDIKLTKDKELVININISDKFNSTRSNNSIDIETPKQITNQRKTNLQQMNETNLSVLNDSQRLNPLQIKPKNTETDKKLMISPSINVQKNRYDLNVVNNCHNASDTVIVQIEDDAPTTKPILQIQQTNSHQQYISINNDRNKNTNNRKNALSRNISIDDHNNHKIKNDNNNNKHHNFSNQKERPEVLKNYQNHNYSNETKNHRRGDSVPRHKSSHDEPKRNIEENTLNYNNQGRDNSAYEIHLHHDGDDYVGNIELRNGKLVRRIRVRKSQRSSSVAPSNSYNRYTSNNPYYQSNSHVHSPIKSHHQNYRESPSKGHDYYSQNHFPNNYSNHGHHHHYPQSENGSNNHHHQRRSSSVNRIRVKKSQLYNLYQQNGNTHNNSRHQNHRSNSVPRKANSPLYNDPKNRLINDDSDINVTYVYSSDYNGNKRPRLFHSEKVDVSTLTNDQKEHKYYSNRKEIETQTPKRKQNISKIGDTFSSSSDEVLDSKSVFVDLSKIDKKEEKPLQSKSADLLETDDLQPMISYDFDQERMSKSQNFNQSNDQSENYSNNSQLSTKAKQRKKSKSRSRLMSKSSSISSISISMATPSPSASEIPTSDYEIIQTPLKDFVKNKNFFISEISSQFQEEEQEIENSSYISLNGKTKQSKENPGKKYHQVDNNKQKSKNRSTNGLFNKNKKENFVKMEKSNMSNLFDVASSSEDEEDDNKKQTPDSSFANNSYKKVKHIKTNSSEINSSSASKHSHKRRRKRVSNEINSHS